MKKYPSRIKYDKSHPVISFRLDRDLKKRLEKVLEGKSFADFVKEGLGVREREKKSVKNAYRKGYHEGFDGGYTRAKREFGVYARCAFCGEKMIVRGSELGAELKKTICRYLDEERWGHKLCIEKAKTGRR